MLLSMPLQKLKGERLVTLLFCIPSLCMRAVTLINILTPMNVSVSRKLFISTGANLNQINQGKQGLKRSSKHFEAMLSRVKTTLLTASILSLILATSFAVRNGHHRAAYDYLQQTLRLKVLQALYPDQRFSRDNFTSLDWLDPIADYANVNYEKYKEIDTEDNYHRENATFFSLVRNEELYLMLQSIKHVEDRFNRRYHYDWVFANDQPFTEQFKAEVSNLVSGNSTFVTIPKEYWSYPDFIDQNKAAETRAYMKSQGIKYGGSESYRHMCRFNSGFFYKLDALKGIKYYWRVEPDIKFTCDLDHDFFRYMRENNKVYGWTMALHEIHTTVYGLFEATKEYFRELHPDHVASDNQVEFITQDNEKTFNMCHFWSNFEIGDLDFLRSEEYDQYFQYLDKKGGFFYERWGDAPVHTFAVSYLLNKTQVHYFDNTGYYHVPHTQCPRRHETRTNLHCTCQMTTEFNWGSRDSCLPYWLETRDEPRPEWAPQFTYTSRRKGDMVKRNLEDQSTLNTIPEREAFLI